MAGGRKREFDREAALSAAMAVFWEKGYAGTSMSDLTDGMGINKPSLYATFGNKETLFVEATEYFTDIVAGVNSDHLTEQGTKLADRCKNFLMGIVATQCDSAHPKGCFVAFSLPQASNGCMPQKAGDKILEVSERVPDLLKEQFLKDEEALQLGLSENAETHALCLSATLGGTAILARSGKTRGELEPIIDNALRGLGMFPS